MASRDNMHAEITPEVLLRAYACGIFPMAESADDPACGPIHQLMAEHPFALLIGPDAPWGESFEEMLAYAEEKGRFVSTKDVTTQLATAFSTPAE